MASTTSLTPGTLDTLSRLKGIETFWSADDGAVATLDTLSRLKGIETNLVCHKLPHRFTLDTLSRLKGIETLGQSRVSN